MLSPASSLPSQLRQSWYLGWRDTEEITVHWVHSVCCGSRWSLRAILLPSSLPSWFWKDWDVHWTLNWTSWRQLSHCSSKLQLLPSNRLVWLLASHCGRLPGLPGSWHRAKLKVRSQVYPRDVVCSGCSPLMLPSVISAKHQAWDDQKVYSRKQKNLHNWTFPTHCTVLRANVLW